MFQFTEYIDARAFFISFCIGIFITYVLAPPKKYIIQYPTPQTSDEKVYKDKADVCYKYQAKEVSCPSDSHKIHKIQPQFGTNENKQNESVMNTLKGILDYEK